LLAGIRAGRRLKKAKVGDKPKTPKPSPKKGSGRPMSLQEQMAAKLAARRMKAAAGITSKPKPKPAAKSTPKASWANKNSSTPKSSPSMVKSYSTTTNHTSSWKERSQAKQNIKSSIEATQEKGSCEAASDQDTDTVERKTDEDTVEIKIKGKKKKGKGRSNKIVSQNSGGSAKVMVDRIKKNLDKVNGTKDMWKLKAIEAILNSRS